MPELLSSAFVEQVIYDMQSNYGGCIEGRERPIISIKSGLKADTKDMQARIASVHEAVFTRAQAPDVQANAAYPDNGKTLYEYTISLPVYSYSDVLQNLAGVLNTMAPPSQEQLAKLTANVNMIYAQKAQGTEWVKPVENISIDSLPKLKKAGLER